jgi:hypothetical protein
MWIVEGLKWKSQYRKRIIKEEKNVCEAPFHWARWQPFGERRP